MADFTDLPEVQRVEQFVDAASRLDETEFRRVHGEGFLVHYGTGGSLRRPARPQATVLQLKEMTPSQPLLPMRELKANFLAYPVKWTGRSPYPRMITVGRTRNNDIVLPDESVSKFHAFFRDSAMTSQALPGTFLVYDAGSRNGTTLDGRPVPVAKEGDAVLVRSGAKLRFGLVPLTFLDAPAFLGLVHQVKVGS